MAYSKKTCSVCGCNGSIKKWTYTFGRNYKAKVCVQCASKLGTPSVVVDWLLKHALYGENGKQLIGFISGGD